MKVIDMPNGPNEFKAGIEQIKRNQPDLIEIIGIVAGLKFQAFTRYVEAGFTPEQALELCKGSVISL